jgi:hypothetical protein
MYAYKYLLLLDYFAFLYKFYFRILLLLFVNDLIYFLSRNIINKYSIK